MGSDPVFVQCVCEAVRGAVHNLSVLIEGETGTGKDAVARHAHAQGARRTGPFVAVNCGRLSVELAGSDLFGHEEGSFTGASRRRQGAFERAAGGTLLLNDICDMRLPVQAELLQVLDDHSFEPVGASSAQPWHGALFCATNRDLRAMVKAGSFRADLFERIRWVHVRLPPLRDRPGDVRQLAAGFLAKVEGRHPEFGPGVLEAFEAYSWPGNVRELEAKVTVLASFPERKLIELRHLGPEILDALSGKTLKGRKIQVMSDSEKRELAASSLEASENIIARAARRMGMTSYSFARMCDRIGLELKRRGGRAREATDGG